MHVINQCTCVTYITVNGALDVICDLRNTNLFKFSEHVAPKCFFGAVFGFSELFNNPVIIRLLADRRVFIAALRSINSVSV